jgi:hypothetical protein
VTLERSICPWCIASGDAARRFDCSFTDPWSLVAGAVPREVVTIVERHTPGYTSWQSEEWRHHCGDACAFLGDVPTDRLATLQTDGLRELFEEHGLDTEAWAAIQARYMPGGDPALYVFKCLHCDRELYNMDCS